MNEKIRYYPKGGMCSVCANRWQDCSKLEFDKMPVHRNDEYGICVICTNFNKESKNVQSRNN